MRRLSRRNRATERTAEERKEERTTIKNGTERKDKREEEEVGE
jgi:hypothetical protein